MADKKWKVIRQFTDAKDEGHLYQVGDTYPRYGGTTNVDRLEELLGCSNSENTPYIVEDSSGGGGGGSDLPEVTAADNGVNLSVVNGAWAKNTPFVATYTKVDDDVWVCDKTLAEYKAAYNAGKAVRAKIVFPADEEEQNPEVTSEVFLSCVELQDVDNGFIGGVAMYFGAYSSISHYSESGTEEISITI